MNWYGALIMLRLLREISKDMFKIILYVVFCVLPVLCTCLPIAAIFGLLYLFTGIRFLYNVCGFFLWIVDVTLSVNFN